MYEDHGFFMGNCTDERDYEDIETIINKWCAGHHHEDEIAAFNFKEKWLWLAEGFRAFQEYTANKWMQDKFPEIKKK